MSSSAPPPPPRRPPAADPDATVVRPRTGPRPDVWSTARSSAQGTHPAAAGRGTPRSAEPDATVVRPAGSTITRTLPQPLPVGQPAPADPDATVVKPRTITRTVPQARGPSPLDPDATVVKPPLGPALQRLPGRVPGHVVGRDHDATVLKPIRGLPQDPTLALDMPDMSALPTLLRAPALALAEGFRLHEYRIDAVLGQGGFGITYLATDVHLNSLVAIKEYLPADIAFRAGDCSVSPNASRHHDRYRQGLESFLLEARTLATFRHASIVRVARFFEAHRTAYMVLDYVRGSPLKAWWAEHGDIGEAGLVELLLPLLDGLAVVHGAGYLHRDIKPDNIQVRAGDGNLVLLDFGSAGQTVVAAEQGAVVLTPGYAPIEQYGLGEQGAWTDIYAMGATLYWCITGNKPPDAETRMANPRSYTPAAMAGKGRYGEAFLKAVDWALQMEPAQRPQDITAWRHALCADHLASLGLMEALQRAHGPEEKESHSLLQRLWARTRRVLARAVSPRDWPLALKMTLAMVATALLPMGITGAYNLRGSTASLAEAELRFVEQMANSTAGRISQLVIDTRYLARSLSGDPDFVAVLNKPERIALAALGDKLVRMVSANPDIQFITLIDGRGRVLVSSDTAQHESGFDASNERWYTEGWQGRAYTGYLMPGKLAPGNGVLLTQPVAEDGGPVKGVLALRLRGTSLAAILDEVRNDATLTPFMLDRNGVVVHHIQEDLVYSSLAPLAADRLAAARADQRYGRDAQVASLGETGLAAAMTGAQRPGHVEYRSAVNGRDEIAGYAPVTAHDWVVGVAKSRADFEMPLMPLKTQLLWSAALIGLLFTGLALRFARSIVRPIRALTASARALKEGNYAQAGVEVKRRDELGELGRTFNVMIDVLKQRERK